MRWSEVGSDFEEAYIKVFPVSCNPEEEEEYQERY